MAKEACRAGLGPQQPQAEIQHKVLFSLPKSKAGPRSGLLARNRQAAGQLLAGNRKRDQVGIVSQFNTDR